MRHVLLAFCLFVPLAVQAAEPCAHTAARSFKADLAGIRSVQVDVHAETLHLAGVVAGGGLVLNGQACASESKYLDALQITQRREGDRLLIEMTDDNDFGLNLFGNRYARLEANLSLPASMPVTLNVGSGDADAAGMQQIQASVGSGDLTVHHLGGLLQARVGSGDIDADGVGSLQMDSVGSGDVEVRDIKADARVGSIGSGDVELARVGGSVQVESLGSGDLSVRDVAGDFSLGHRGSGDVEHSGVRGRVSLPAR